jgi:hypothetical protein
VIHSAAFLSENLRKSDGGGFAMIRHQLHADCGLRTADCGLRTADCVFGRIGTAQAIAFMTSCGCNVSLSGGRLSPLRRRSR